MPKPSLSRGAKHRYRYQEPNATGKLQLQQSEPVLYIPLPPLPGFPVDPYFASREYFVVQSNRWPSLTGFASSVGGTFQARCGEVFDACVYKI